MARWAAGTLCCRQLPYNTGRGQPQAEGQAVMGDAWGCCRAWDVLPSSELSQALLQCWELLTAHSVPLPYEDAGFPHTLEKYQIFQ